LQKSTRIYRSLVVGGESIIVSTISSAFALIPGAAGLYSVGPPGAIVGFSIGYTSAYSTLFGMIDNDQIFNWLELNQ